MGIPLRQKLRIVAHVFRERLGGRRRFALVLMLEPLFQCNLACAGCGKIAYPESILKQRLSVSDCLAAAEECRAPVVSIAGGEPLLHKDLPAIVEGLIARKRYVYLCTNGLLLSKRLKHLPVSPRLVLSVHLDGESATHDRLVAREGVQARAAGAIEAALAAGHRVTVNCTVFADGDAGELTAFFDRITAWGVSGITVAPGFRYREAPRGDVFLGREQSIALFRTLLAEDSARRWPLSHSPFYLEFLAGHRDLACSPWASPTRNVFGWQKPCYLLDEGTAPDYEALVESRSWERYGMGRHPGCADCMAHCGYEPTAVMESLAHPLATGAALLGPALETMGTFGRRLALFRRDDRSVEDA